jgi:hypothetical protein
MMDMILRPSSLWFHLSDSGKISPDPKKIFNELPAPLFGTTSISHLSKGSFSDHSVVENFKEIRAATQRPDTSSTHRFCRRGIFFI